MTPTLLIKNGMIMDGTGARAFRGDVVVRDGAVKEIGIFPDADAQRVIDAAGSVIAPGFIDVHTHLDFLLASERHAAVMERWVRQGVTTLIAGNCGFSPAPLDPDCRKEISTYWNFALPRKGLQFEWTNMGEYLDHLEKNGQALNVAILTGHNVLRASAMGFQARFANQPEIDKMKTMLKASLEAGAIGLSAGLFYCPGIFSHTDELSQLTSVLGEFEAVLATHTRGLSQTYDQAVAEVIQVAEQNNVRLQLSHHAGGDSSKRKIKTTYGLTTRTALWLLRLLGKKYFLKLVSERNRVRARAVRAVNAAMDRGVKIGHDNMPWACGPTTALAMLPPWLFDGGVDQALARLEDGSVRKRAADQIRTLIPAWPNWENDWWTDNFLSLSARLSGFQLEKNLPFENQSLAGIAKELRKDPYETFFDLIIEEKGRLFIIDGLFDHPSGDDFIEYLLSDPNCAIMTDVVGADFTTTNPVSYGAFTKVLGYFARDRGIMSQEEAVRRMTSLPAEQMGLQGRGVLKKGAAADIVIFNPETVDNLASFQHPHRLSRGIQNVLINGKAVFEQGKYDDNAELKGIADGSGLDYKTIFIANFLSDLNMAMVEDDIKKATECSSVVASGPATRDGKLIFGRNTDYSGQGRWAAHQTVVLYEPDGAKRYVKVSTAGMIKCNSAMNEKGITVGGHFMAFSGSSPEGASFSILENEIMRKADNLKDALKIVGSTNRSGSFGLMVADGKTGQAVAIEATQDLFAQRAMKNSTIWMTNYARTPDLESLDLLANHNLAMRDIAGRYQRVGDLLQSHFGMITPASMAEIMSDHVDGITGTERGAGSTICGVSNVTSVIFVPKEKHFWVATGPEPVCANAYIGFDFDAEFDGTAPDVSPANLAGYQWQENAKKQGLKSYMDAYIAYGENHADIEAVIQKLTLAQKADPTECTYSRLLASFLIQQGNYEGATALLNECLESKESHNENALTHLLLGLVHDLQENRQDAQLMYQKIVAIRAQYGNDFFEGINDYLHLTAMRALENPLTIEELEHVVAFSMTSACQ
jgi:N-acyl-D-amino-acid deacylase